MPKLAAGAEYHVEMFEDYLIRPFEEQVAAIASAKTCGEKFERILAAQKTSGEIEATFESASEGYWETSHFERAERADELLDEAIRAVRVRCFRDY
jgi:hypothetical protein